MVTVGFIGLGLMGSGIAANIQRAGYRMIVNDLSQQAAIGLVEAGAAQASTAREVAERADLIFTSLPTPKDVEAVYAGPDGLAAGFRRGGTWFDLTTNSLQVVRRLHAALAGNEVAFLDAPVSGGPSGAAGGTLAIWAGGDATVFNRFRPVLETFADKPEHVGPIGAGTVAKLGHNLASAAMNAVTVEVLTLGVAAGLDPLAMWGALRSGAAGRRRSFDAIAARFLAGQVDQPSFELRLLAKDLGLAQELAHDVNVPIPLGECVLADVTEAMNRGWGRRDSQAALLVQQERAGIPAIAVDPEKIRAVIERT